MKPLNTLTFPLSGPSLIEASAGTGKTYTIVNLFLRLLLGHRCSALGIEQILLVTFTQAATAELKTRIGDKLRQSYLDFYAGHSGDPFVQQLIEELNDNQLACQRLDLASKQLDEAAIFTIHGFCQRMLSQHAFESGAMYEQQFILDESQWLKLAVEDYWRKHIVSLEPNLLSLFLAQWANPEDLLKDIRPLLSRQAQPLQVYSVPQCEASLEHYQQLVNRTKHWWLENNVTSQLAGANLKGNMTVGKAYVLEAMQAFCHNNELYPDFHADGWGVFLPEKIVSAQKKTGSADLSHLDFSQFEALQASQVECQNILRLAFSQQALQEVRRNLVANKQRLQLLAPDDLLSSLQKALGAGYEIEQNKVTAKQAQTLAKSIQQAYPAVLIDEFQDTDPVQFSVFSEIYRPCYLAQPACWIMIGDPKQAIYAFRGADIFTYIEAKQLVPPEQQFTLDTNWRSSKQLVDAVNGLFSQSQKGFLFEQNIPFYPVQAAKKGQGLKVCGESAVSLSFEHLQSPDGGNIAWNVAQGLIARHVSANISHLLIQAQQGQATINDRALLAGDICVLVRDRMEADLIKQALAQLNVASVFLVRKSVFATQTAADLYLLLKAMANPGEERLLKLALMSELFAFNAQQLDAMFDDELAWQQLLECNQQWHKDWQYKGLMLALNKVCNHFDLYSRLAKHYHDGLRRLTDLRHVSDLLQQQSAVLKGEVQLLHWFQEMLKDPDDNHEGQQLRLETEANLVKIITQHSAKGLEFPIVFIPFASRAKSVKKANKAIFHDDKQNLRVDLLAQDESLTLEDTERLAEDIRLLYVALTRAVYFCSVGIWNCALGASKKHSALLTTALGNILFKHDSSPDDQLIKSTIKQLAQELDIAYKGFSQVETAQRLPLHTSNSQHSAWQGAKLDKPIERIWQLTSYSAISSAQQHLEQVLPGMDEGPTPQLSGQDQEEVESTELSAFSFERGAKAGSFLHAVLEEIDFQNCESLPQVIEQKGSWYGIDRDNFVMLKTWLWDVLNSKFCKDDKAANSQLCLSALSKSQLKVEMEFHMPLQKVRVVSFNKLINQFNPQHGRHYQFSELNGMLKGYIDLMFEFNGKYYVADYKSNHLGNNLQSYQLASLEEAMIEHDYHLQAILYTLALHRWLKQKLTNYDYDQHIGGAYYLFLRGMSSVLPGSGVYFYQPAKSLIMALDELFSGLTNEIELDSTAQKGQLNLW
jgi:exodeoxyribonuclease V beta subunit